MTEASEAFNQLALQLSQVAGGSPMLEVAHQQLAAAVAATGRGGSDGGFAPRHHAPPRSTTGVVRAWYDDKGFGFIAPDDGSQDVFIHRKQLHEGQVLAQGTQVTFDYAHSSSSGKPAASRITVIGSGGVPASPLPATLPSMSSGIKGGPEPSDNLFIAGLPADITEEKLKSAFGQYGLVTSVRILPDIAGKEDKSALVRMSDVSQAAWMVEHLNGNIPDGLPGPVFVKFSDNRAARARELGLPKPNFGPGGGGGYGAAPRHHHHQQHHQPQTQLALARPSPYGAGAGGGAGALGGLNALGALGALGGAGAGEALQTASALLTLVGALTQLTTAASGGNAGGGLAELLQGVAQNLSGLH